MTLTNGSLLQSGRYRISKTGIQDASSISYLGTQTFLDRPVLLQTFSPAVQHSEHSTMLRQVFQSVTQRLTDCQHPNLVKVLDGFTEEELPYIVFEHPQGQTLEEAQKVQSRRSLSNALRYTRQVGSALHTLHQHGLWHLNLTPDRILFCQDTDSVVLTAVNVMQQFPADLFPLLPKPPRPEPIDATVDLRALANLLYWMLAGQAAPAPVSTEEELTAPLQQLSIQLPRSVETALTMVLCGDVRHLYASCASPVEQWLQQLPNSAAAPALIPQQSASQQSASQQPAKRQANPSLPFESGKLKQPVGTATKVAADSTRRSPVKRRQANSSHFGRWVAVVAAIAAVGGAGAGLALRWGSQTAENGGSALFNREQTFPTSENWPGVKASELDPEIVTNDFLFESGAGQWDPSFDRSTFEPAPIYTPPAPVSSFTGSETEWNDPTEEVVGDDGFASPGAENEPIARDDEPADIAPTPQLEPATLSDFIPDDAGSDNFGTEPAPSDFGEPEAQTP